MKRLFVPVFLCATLAAVPAFADRGHKKHHRHDGYYRDVHRTVVYREPVYRVVPAPVYLGPPVVMAPPAYYHGYGRPVHHHHHGCGHDNDAWMWIGGGMAHGCDPARHLRLNAVAEYMQVDAEEGAADRLRAVAEPADMDAFLRSVERRGFLMARVALGSEADAMDVLQDTMLRLVQSYAARPAAEWRALFFRILQNCITDVRRRRKVSALLTARTLALSW